MKNGGPAFPGPHVMGQKGMTMRQYYKAKALEGELACQSAELGAYGNSPEAYEVLAERCAQIADTMIAEDEAFTKKSGEA